MCAPYSWPDPSELLSRPRSPRKNWPNHLLYVRWRGIGFSFRNQDVEFYDRGNTFDGTLRTLVNYESVISVINQGGQHHQLLPRPGDDLLDDMDVNFGVEYVHIVV